MSKICTDIEQSKKLIELGLNINTSDMYYSNLDSNKYNLYVGLSVSVKENHFPYINGLVVPAWSLNTLLEIISNVNCIWIGSNSPGTWVAEFNLGQGKHHITLQQDYPIDAIFEMVCWLLENKYINK